MSRRSDFDAEPFTPLPLTFTHRLHTLHKLSDRISQAAYVADAAMSMSEGRCLAAVGALEPMSVNDLAQGANLDKGQASRAAQALVAAGDSAAADAAVLQGLVGHPTAAALAIYGAQRRMENNDLPGAHLLLRRTPEAALTLRDRKAMEELSAQLADREGDPSAAILARTRARMLSQKLETHDR